MEIVTFSLGLGLGILLVGLQHIRLNRSLYRLLARLEPNIPQPRQAIGPFNLASRLMAAVGQQHQQQFQLEQLLNRVQQLITHAPIAYIQVDCDNYLVWCNQEASRLIQIAQPSPERPRLLLEQIRSYELDRLIEKTRQGQQPYQRRWVLHPLNPDPLNPDPQRSIHLMGHGIPLPEGQVGVFLENEQELFQLAQQRDRWVSDVAHELKTPLTSIRLVAEMLEERVAEAHKPWMQRLLGEVIHLSSLVHDLLDLNMLEQRSPQSLNINKLDLVALIHSAWQSLEPISSTKSLQFSYRGPDQAEFEADQSRFYRVILNLLDNAIKYSPTASTITVCLGSGDSRAEGPADRPADGPAARPAHHPAQPYHPGPAPAQPASQPAASQPAASQPAPLSSHCSPRLSTHPSPAQISASSDLASSSNPAQPSPP
ncbi:MAG: histidine kinase, partial [Synechococcales cyanobacterium RM1_1_8]|nr:histidine kinase [Synechococcales cyanobacterium RM1_1_8]